MSLVRALASQNHFFFFFLSSDFYESWCSMMSICLLNEVKQQWAMFVLGWVTVSVLDDLWDDFFVSPNFHKF